MKKFVVSEKCIACGNCLLETKLLQEDVEGKAVPVNGGYFSDDFLAKAEEIVARAPAQTRAACFPDSGRRIRGGR